MKLWGLCLQSCESTSKICNAPGCSLTLLQMGRQCLVDGRATKTTEGELSQVSLWKALAWDN